MPAALRRIRRTAGRIRRQIHEAYFSLGRFAHGHTALEFGRAAHRALALLFGLQRLDCLSQSPTHLGRTIAPANYRHDCRDICYSAFARSPAFELSLGFSPGHRARPRGFVWVGHRSHTSVHVWEAQEV